MLGKKEGNLSKFFARLTISSSLPLNPDSITVRSVIVIVAQHEAHREPDYRLSGGADGYLLSACRGSRRFHLNSSGNFP